MCTNAALHGYAVRLHTVYTRLKFDWTPALGDVVERVAVALERLGGFLPACAFLPSLREEPAFSRDLEIELTQMARDLESRELEGSTLGALADMGQLVLSVKALSISYKQSQLRGEVFERNGFGETAGDYMEGNGVEWEVAEGLADEPLKAVPSDSITVLGGSADSEAGPISGENVDA